MTTNQIICMTLIMIIFIALMIALFETLYCIGSGEYKKAFYSSIVSVVLTIIVFVGILIAF